MDDKWINMLDEDRCPDANTLLSYTEGLLSGEELRRVERHLAACELCSDAVEGLSMNTGNVNPRKELEELEARITERFVRNHPKPKESFPWLRVAAVLFLAAVGSVLFYLVWNSGNNKKLLTENIPVHDSSGVQEGSQKIVPLSEERAATSGKTADNPGEREKNISESATNAQRPELAKTKPSPAVSPMEESSSDVTGLAENERVSDGAKDLAADRESKSISEKIPVMEAPPAAAPQTTRVTAAAAENKERSSGAVSNSISAAETLDEIVLQKEFNADTVAMARALMDKKDFAGAVSLLEKYVAQHPLNKFPDAGWNLSNAYVGNNQKDKARSILQKLSANFPEYKTRADKLLKSLE